ncbi:hypothetical protein U1Q18_025175, partial [Sarracenia purpurea var. burkii]
GPPDPQLSGFIFMSPSSPTPSMAHHRQQPAPPCNKAAEEDDLGDEVPTDNRTEEDEDESGQETKNEVDGAEGDLEVDDEDEEDSSPVIDEVNRSDSGIVLIPDRISSSVKDCNLGEVVKVRLVIDHAVNLSRGYGYVEFKTRADAEKAQAYMDGGQIDGNIVRTKFTLPERKKVSPPPKVVPTASKREAPKIDNVGADVENDGQKRQREPSPRRKPHSPLRRRSPVARRGGSPRREIDSPPRRRVNSPVRRRAESPYRRGETPLRRRPASPVRGQSPARTCICEVMAQIFFQFLIPEVLVVDSSTVMPPANIQYAALVIGGSIFIEGITIGGRAPAAKRGRSSSYSDSPSPRRVCICSAQGIKES